MSWLSKATGIDIKIGSKDKNKDRYTGTPSVMDNSGGTSPSGGTVGQPTDDGSTANRVGNPYYSGSPSKTQMEKGYNTLSKPTPSAANGSTGSLSVSQVRDFMGEGRARGEEITGTNAAGVGEGRENVRDRLRETLDGNSAGASALRQDQAQQQKSLRAQQAVAGQGQMNAGQQQALQRQSQRDLAGFISQEKRQSLSDLSKEYRGAGGDIMRSEGQYGAVLVGAQPPATPEKDTGFFSGWF